MISAPIISGNPSHRRVLVFGASGYIGSHLVPALLERGYLVRACARNEEVLKARGWDGAELVTADALRPATLESALRGVVVAYYLVHSMAAGRDFDRLDAQAAEHFRQAAERAGVQRIIYLGGIIPLDPLSTHLRSRLETGERLRAGRVPVTEIRAGMIVGPGSAAFEVIRDLVNYLPVMITPRWVQSRSAPIALDNLLEYLIRVSDLPDTGHQIYDAGGPETLSYEEIMRVYGTVVGKNPRIWPVPLLTPRLSSYWLRLVTSVPTNVARALIEGLKQDVLVDDHAIRQRIPQRLLTFTESVEAALKAERCEAVVARWVEGSMKCRGYRPEYGFYAKKVGDYAISSASRSALWRVLIAIGGRNGYYHLNSLWWMRAVLDWLAGGPSFRRGRRHPAELRVGDTVDAWRVIALEPERRLTLLLEMKTPGSGVLEFEITPQPKGNRISATAYFHPAGPWGLFYWYGLMPFHAEIFRGLTRAIARQAEEAERGDDDEGNP